MTKGAEENREFFIVSVKFGNLCLYLYCSGLCEKQKGEKWLKGCAIICKVLTPDMLGTLGK